jgi:hypothetical protein
LYLTGRRLGHACLLLLLDDFNHAGMAPSRSAHATNVKMRVRRVPQGTPPTLLHKLFIADEHQALVYVATFEALEKEWEAAWTPR